MIMRNIIYRAYKKGDEKQLADLFNKSFQMNGASFIRTSKSWNWRYLQSPSFEPFYFFFKSSIFGHFIL